MIKISEQISEFIKERIGLGDTHQSISNQIYDVFGVNIARRTIGNHVARLNKSDVDLNVPNMPSKASYRDNGTQLSINADGSQTSSTVIQMQADQIKDVNYVLRAHGFSETDWELVSARNNFWQQNNSEQGLVDLYQSKITVKPKLKSGLQVDEIVKSFNNVIKSVEVTNITKGDDNIVIPLFDMHFGITKLDMLEDHLHKIANILKKGYKRVEIIIGGDVLHSDFVTKTQTASNTQLDHVETIRALNEAESFFSTLISMALELSEIVEVKAVSGNHDTDSQFYFVWGMSKKFPQVAFDNQLNGTRLAFQFGKIGIMVAHGNLALKRLPMLFANEFPDIWSSSNYRMVASGHYHTEKLADTDGVVMHQFGTVKPNDPYEHANGYTVARKHLQMLEFDNEKLIATYEIE